MLSGKYSQIILSKERSMKFLRNTLCFFILFFKLGILKEKDNSSMNKLRPLKSRTGQVVC